MPQNPYAPPTALVRDRGPDRAIAEKPAQVTYAVWLLWLAIPLSIPASMYEYERMPADEKDPVLLLFYVVIYAIAMAINVLVSRGHDWARILTLLLFVVALATFIFDEYTAYPFVPLASNLVVLILDAIALYLLFTSPGKLWFRSVR
jgi:hypothetical protein